MNAIIAEILIQFHEESNRDVPSDANNLEIPDREIRRYGNKMVVRMATKWLGSGRITGMLPPISC